jgi:hypothetical protein
MTREGYSHELISCGFWPGNDASPSPVFYAYSAPEPPGFQEAPIRPSTAFYSADAGEYLLPYQELCTSATPEQDLLDFFQSTYTAGATLGKWDRESLERKV